MKKVLFLFLISALCLPIMAATVARYNGMRIFWDSRSPVTVFDAGGYARLIELADGRLMACCESGGIKISFSSDGGKSWSTPRLIAPNANGTPNCVPDLIQLSDGTIIVGYNPRPTAPYTSDRHFGIRLRKSTNGGKTWSDEIFVYNADITFENGCWEPSFLELPSGELQLYFADEGPYTSSSEQQISMCRSFDGGETWTEPQRISFRSGFRDGMPVPVLLNDKKYIVVAIEDNGWSGVNDFIPTTIRVSLANNWRNNYYVNGSSNMRTQCVNYNYNPMARGGAPYLRVLPSGETVLSHQSTYGDGDNMKMYVYVGNSNAKDFKAMSRPFYQGTKSCWWNSLSVIDTGTVVAVGGMDGKIVITKGYPMKTFQATFATPKIDGRRTSTDAYCHPKAQQVPMGSETGTFSYTDFAYDNEKLYMICQVFRPRPRSEEPFPDGINFYVEAVGASGDSPAVTSHMFSIRPDGTITTAKGTGRDWRETTMEGPELASYVTTLGYQVELAIPWTSIGLDHAPVGEKLSVNIEVLTGDGTSQQVERIADALPTKPATWMLLNLLKNNATGISQIHNSNIKIQNEDAAVYDLGGRRLSNRKLSNGQIPHGIYIAGGRKTALRK